MTNLDLPPLLRELEDYRTMVDELESARDQLQTDVDALRSKVEVAPGIPLEVVNAYVDAVDVYLASGSAGAVSAWKNVKVAREKVDAAVALVNADLNAEAEAILKDYVEE